MANPDVIQGIVGDFGLYQLVLCILLFYAKIFIAFHQMGIIFLAPKVSFKCGSKDNFCPCENPTYNTTIFTRTIITRWNLICERKWLVSMTQTLFQLGVLLGSVLFGMAADRFGRKPPLVFAVVVQTAAGIAAAFAPDYWTFTTLRFIVGLTVGGTMGTTFVILMEFVGKGYREAISALYQIPFNAGHFLLAVVAYYLRDYSNFQLSISLPAILMLGYFCTIPESPRWLIAVNKSEDAVKVLERAAKMNKRPTENISSSIETYKVNMQKSQLKKGSIVDLFRYPNMRKNIIIMSMNWFACSYCFYGVAQYVGQLSGDVFANVAASAGVTLIGTLLSMPLMRMTGRRTILIVFNFVNVTCLLALAIVQEGAFEVVLACTGVVSSFIVFIVVYLYCTEMFPTVVRNAALGFSSMSARMGSMLAPFVIDLRSNALWLPPVVFAIAPLIAGSSAFFMPETKGCELLNTIEEGEAFGKKTPNT